MNEIKLKYDILYEWVAMHLCDKYEVELKDVNTKLSGIFNRAIKTDVEQILIEENAYGDKISFKVNRGGIYDNLPKALFHSINAIDGYSRDIEEDIQFIKQAKKEEDEIREFFHIFENEIFKTNISIKQSFRSSLDFLNDHVNEEIKNLLSIDTEFFTKEEFSNILFIFPLIKTIKLDNYAVITSMMFNLIFRLNAVVSLFYRESTKAIKETELTCLGQTYLGWDLVPGKVLSGFDLIARVEVEIDNDSQTNEFISKINSILDWITPLNFNKELIIVDPKKENFILGKSILGSKAA